MSETPFTARLSGLNLDAVAGRDIAAADDARAALLQSLGALRSARGNALARERARLADKHGDADPRVAELDLRIAGNAGLVRDVTVETDHARTSIPVVDASAWAVHGYVRDASLAGVKGVNVALYDAAGRWLSQYGYNCTDERGHFQLVVKLPATTPTRSADTAGSSSGPSAGGGISTVGAPGVSSSGFSAGGGISTVGTSAGGSAAGGSAAGGSAAGGSTAGGSAAGGSTQGGTTGSVAAGPSPLLHVVDQKNTTLFIDTIPVTLQAGTVEYRIFVLGSGASACPPPGNANNPGPGSKA